MRLSLTVPSAIAVALCVLSGCHSSAEAPDAGPEPTYECYSGDAYCTDAGQIVTCHAPPNDATRPRPGGAWNPPSTCSPGHVCAPPFDGGGPDYQAFCAIGDGPEPGCDAGWFSYGCHDNTHYAECAHGYAIAMYDCAACDTTCRGGLQSDCQTDADCLPGLQCHDYGAGPSDGPTGPHCSAPCLDDAGTNEACSGADGGGIWQNGLPTGWWPGGGFCRQGWCETTQVNRGQ